MYQQERIDQIMKILKENHYVTVDYLVKEIRYSPASIRRDLTLLEKQGLVTRSYGGATLKDANSSPFRFRQHSMKIAKNAIAKKATDLIKENDIVFIDGSSTTQYMGHFLLQKKGITVVTSNMVLANYLGENGITTYCTGGKILEYPGILGGDIMVETVAKFNIDIAFFATTSFSTDGKILTPTEVGAHAQKSFRANSKKLAYLCGSDKFDAPGKFVSMTLDDVDFFISDSDLAEEVKKRYKNTQFISTK